MMNYQGFLSDFDGTVHIENQMVSAEVLTALRRLIDAGVKFGFCTGRQFDFIRPFASQFGEVHLTCGGACLVDREGRLLRQTVIPAETVREIVRIVEAGNGTLVLKHHDQGYGNEAALQHAKTRPGLNLLPISDLPDWNLPAFFISQLDDQGWQELVARTDVNLIQQRFRSGMPGNFVDGVALGANKGTGVTWWCEYHDLDPQSVIGIGDGENDIDLFEAVGLGLAMGNAVPELLEKAGASVPTVEANGVAWAIKHYFRV